MQYAVSLLILGEPVFAGHIEASSPAVVRDTWAQKFFNDVEDFKTAVPLMDAANKAIGEKLLSSMIEKRDLARSLGYVVTARASRAKGAA